MPNMQLRARQRAAAKLPIERTSTACLKRLRSGRSFGGNWPSKLKTLPDAAKLLVHAMVHGLEKDQGEIKARQPLTLIEACGALSFETRKMLQLARHKLFTEELMEQLNTRRVLEYARNLGIAMEIRDSRGDGTPRADEVRLKAIMTIEGAFKVGGGPNVQINNIQQNNATQDNLKPGYIIRTSPPKVIEHEP